MAGVSNVLVLEKAEVAQEVSPGTMKAMTRPLYFVQGTLDWTYDVPMDDAKEAMGTKYQTEGVEGGIPTTRINLEAVLAYQDVPWWMDKALGAINLGAPSALGGVPPAYSYGFSPSGSAFNLNTFCMIAGDAAQAYGFTRCLINKAVFRFNPQSGGEAHWRMAAEIWAQFAGVDTFESPADYARTKILTKGTAITADSVGGTIGTTPWLKTRSGNITIDNQLEEKIYTENTTAVASDWGFGEQIVTSEVVAEFAGDTEFALFRAGTRRQVRIQQLGAVISGANARTLRFDLPRAHIVSFKPGRAGQNKIATIGMVGETDRANAIVRPLSATVISDNATVAA